MVFRRLSLSVLVNDVLRRTCKSGTHVNTPTFTLHHAPFETHLTLLLLGLSGILVGWTFKLNHLMGAEQVFNAGMLALVAGLLLAIRDVWKRRDT